MTNQYNISEAKKDFSYLIQQIENGNSSEIFIARNGKRVAKLVPDSGTSSCVSNRIGFAKGQLIINDEFDKTFDALDEDLASQMIGGSL